jgi:hypothetical protein
MVRTEPHLAWVDRPARWHTWAAGGPISPVCVYVAVVAVARRATVVDAASFTESLPQGVFTPALRRTLATSIARAVPVVGASAGFVYRFDWETGSFQREPARVGQL